MKEVLFLILISGFVFLIFLVNLILGITKKNKTLLLTALFVFLAFIGCVSWTGFKVLNKTYNKVTDTFKPRTGDEIYDALFDKRQTDCVKILNYQDQVIPKIDYAIWLHFETCPQELERILSKHHFDTLLLSTDTWNSDIQLVDSSDWFNPKTLGDTIMMYEYSSHDYKNIQTIWTNLEHTEAFVRDILD